MKTLRPLLALDVETESKNEEAWPTGALHPLRSSITIFSTYGTGGGHASRDLSLLDRLARCDLVGHNLKFDLKHLIMQGFNFTVEQYKHDSMLMAVAFSQKIPEEWLEAYEVKRKELNKLAGRAIHREAGGYSLKTLAPFFLNIPPFWEAANHDDEEYVMKDAMYSYQLYEFFSEELEKEGSYEFYETKLMPWARMILEAEMRGIAIDLPRFPEKAHLAETQAAEAALLIQKNWSEGFSTYLEKQKQEIEQEYEAKKQTARDKMVPSRKKNPELAKQENIDKYLRIGARYDEMRDRALAKVEPLNLGSPTQLSWLLGDFLGYDLTTFESKDWKETESSTGKEVLQRLVDDGKPDVAALLDWRAATKIKSSFLDAYLEEHVDGRLYGSFNLAGTRTGRLSSSGPNLQQIPSILHDLFIADPGRTFINYDLANIEPLLIAYESEDPLMCDLMLNEKSFHDHNVMAWFGFDHVDKKKHKRERDGAKECGLSLLYGAYINRILGSYAKRGFSFSRRQGKEMYQRFRDSFETVFDYKAALEAAYEAGESIRNIFGRPVVAGTSVKMQLFNTKIQSGASDLLLESSRRAYDRCKAEGLDAYPLIFVHDQVIFSAADKDTERADVILKEELTRWEMKTPFGVIRSQCEGGIANYWSK